LLSNGIFIGSPVDQTPLWRRALRFGQLRIIAYLSLFLYIFFTAATRYIQNDWKSSKDSLPWHPGAVARHSVSGAKYQR
jgi:hypothetical protein